MFFLIYAPQFTSEPEIPLRFPFRAFFTPDSGFTLCSLYSCARSRVMTPVATFIKDASHVHMLRRLQPDFVYIEEVLAGSSVVTSLQTWFQGGVFLVYDHAHKDALSKISTPKIRRWKPLDQRDGGGPRR